MVTNRNIYKHLISRSPMGIRGEDIGSVLGYFPRIGLIGLGLGLILEVGSLAFNPVYPSQNDFPESKKIRQIEMKRDSLWVKYIDSISKNNFSKTDSLLNYFEPLKSKKDSLYKEIDKKSVELRKEYSVQQRRADNLGRGGLGLIFLSGIAGLSYAAGRRKGNKNWS